MRISFWIGLTLLLLSGCAVLEPDFGVPKEEHNVTKSVIKIEKEHNLSRSELKKEESAPKEEPQEAELLENVFDDELYFEKDKVGVDKVAVVIKYVDAYPWEKKALRGAYAKYKRLWSKKQSQDFREILEEDRYLSLCSDHRYWENLQFEEGEVERDVLQSILLMRYLNNLANGCPKWVESDGKIRDENAQEKINTKQIFSLLPHEVIIEKLLLLYLPKDEAFNSLLKKYQQSLQKHPKEVQLKEERLAIEALKCKQCQPNYTKRRE